MSLIPTKLEELIEQFFNTAPGRELLAHNEEKIIQQRHRSVALIAELGAQGAEWAKYRDAQLAKEIASHAATVVALEKSSKAIAVIRAKDLSESVRRNAVISEQERLLEQTAAPELIDFIEEARTAIDAAITQGISSAPLGIRTPLAGFPVRLLASNKRSMWQFMDIAREILADAKCLLIVADQSEAVKKIPTMRERLADAWASVSIDTVEIFRPSAIAENKP
jgi:hypothetical protein